MQSDEKTKIISEKPIKKTIPISLKNHTNLSKLRIQVQNKNNGENKFLSDLADDVIEVGLPEYRKKEDL